MNDSKSPSTKVDIFGTQYSIKPTEDLPEGDIRALANYVDLMMRQMSNKGYDKADATILAALNIALEMRKERKRYEGVIQHLVERMDEAVAEEVLNERLRDTSTFNPESESQSQS